jgi:uncharacterized protein
MGSSESIVQRAQTWLSFEWASTVFLDAFALTVFDSVHSQQDERGFTLGLDANGLLLAVSLNFRATTLERSRVRIISARPATRRERQFHEDEPR